MFLHHKDAKYVVPEPVFSKAVLPVGSLEKRFMELSFAKPDVPVSQLCADIATYSWLRNLHRAVPLLQPQQHQLSLSNQSIALSLQVTQLL